MPYETEYVDPALVEENIYSDEVREQILEDDGLSPSEAAFLQGYTDS